MKTKFFGDRSRLLRLLSAIVIALLSWYYVNGDTSSIVTETINDIPVSYTNVEELTNRGLFVSDEVSYYVNLQVQGSSKSLREVQTQEITAEADLSSITEPGTYEVEVVVKGIANSIIINRIVPNTVSVTIDEISDKKWEPLIIPQGKPIDGKSVISAKTNQTVEISGPQTSLDRISSVSGIIDVNGLSENSAQYVALTAYDEEGNALDDLAIYPRSVYAEVTLGVTKEVKVNTPKITGDTATGYQITDVIVRPDRVTIAGSEYAVDQIDSIDLLPIELNASNNNRSFTVEDELRVPGDIILIRDKKTVEVSIAIESVIEKKFTVSKIETENGRDQTRVSKINAESAVVRIRGTAAELAKIQASELKATIDLDKRSPGTYSLPLTVTSKHGTVISVEPGSVEVTIVNQ